MDFRTIQTNDWAINLFLIICKPCMSMAKNLHRYSYKSNERLGIHSVFNHLQNLYVNACPVWLKTCIDFRTNQRNNSIFKLFLTICKPCMSLPKNLHLFLYKSSERLGIQSVFNHSQTLYVNGKKPV